MDWITDNIAVGNFEDAQNLPPEIDAVLCLKDGCCAARDDIDAICVPLIDGPGNPPDTVREADAYLEEVVNAGRRILVHCHAGRSRSVIIVARHLMASQRISSTDALAMIAAKRQIYLSDGIEELLLIRK